MIKMKQILGLLVFMLALTSCSKNEEGSSVTLKMSAINQNLKSASLFSSDDMQINDFRLSFRDVEFKQDESDLINDEVEFRGPFDVDLMDGTDALTQTIGTAEVPEGTYKVLRFKLHKDKDRLEIDPLYDRSIYMTGTIRNKPFVFWHDTSENFDFENPGGIVVSDGNVEISVNFAIDDFLNSLHNIDLTRAIDRDSNGIIEINPDDDDENKDIADQLKDNIKHAADLIKL